MWTLRALRDGSAIGRCCSQVSKGTTRRHSSCRPTFRSLLSPNSFDLFLNVRNLETVYAFEVAFFQKAFRRTLRFFRSNLPPTLLVCILRRALTLRSFVRFHPSAARVPFFQRPAINVQGGGSRRFNSWLNYSFFSITFLYD
ncbi:hypothetical protein SAMN05428961_102867 [Paenibacillus sp. OK060]|nr:hypothetical protein SAMN05428961_102867 [Paenibacillus sp. OK060]